MSSYDYNVVVPGTEVIGNTATNVVTLCAQREIITDTKYSLLSTIFYRESDDQLPTYLSGAFRGNFVPMDAFDNIELVGEVIVDDTPSIPKDIFFGWVINPEFQEFYRTYFRQHYAYQTDTGLVSSNNDVDVKMFSYAFESSNNHSPYTLESAQKPYRVFDTYPVAVAPLHEDSNDNRVHTYIGNTKVNGISSFTAYHTILSGLTLSSMFVDSNNGYSDTIELYSGASQDGKGFGSADVPASLNPTSISVDKDRNYWVAMRDGSFVMHVSGTNSHVDRVYRS